VTAAATHNSSNLAPGYKLDRYELLCPIAEGGMARVWVARQRGKHGFEKLVAIKTILPAFASDPRFQEMFLDEARIASRIEHPNVTQILDLGEEHEVLYLAMEYVDGDALSRLNHACIRAGVKIPPGVLLRVLADTCAGLHDAHEMIDSSGHPLEVVHRDVSPHNILVSTKGVAKLIDFGIAKARSRAGGDTNSGVLKGKTQYMAPEQAAGKPVDRRADIWAVGVVLYFLLSGRPPFEAENQLATLHLLASGQPPPPLPSTVHPAIAAVVRKTLWHAPESRYQTAAELREALERAIVEARVPTTQADVAAFAGKYLGERAEKRRQSIDLALAAAAERRRVEEQLRPTNDSGVTPAATPDGARSSIPTPSIPAPSSHALLAAQEATRREGGVGKWTPPDGSPNSRSSATLGSASSLDATEAPISRGSRRSIGVIAMLAIAAVATGVTLALVQPKPVPPAPAAALPAATVNPVPSATAPNGAPAQKATPAPPPTGAVGGGAVGGSTGRSAQIPIVAASALPKVKDPAPPPRAASAPPAPAAPKARPALAPAPKNQAVDDGF
jgi:serine/threonine protein kinase